METTENRIGGISAYTNPFGLLNELIPGCATDMADEYFLVRIFPSQNLTLRVAKKRQHGFGDDVRIGGWPLTPSNDAFLITI
ncbi:MAG TPA: hypothetical protein VFV38_10285 [Ktedonobacteraceae bacterium]|nr:hypothetical protein [Ktedonobacteraceae bacterium]